METCPACAENITENDTICPHCGTPTSNKQVSKSIEKPNPNKKKLVLFGTIFTVLSTGIVLWVLLIREMVDDFRCRGGNCEICKDLMLEYGNKAVSQTILKALDSVSSMSEYRKHMESCYIDKCEKGNIGECKEIDKYAIHMANLTLDSSDRERLQNKADILTDKKIEILGQNCSKDIEEACQLLEDLGHNSNRFRARRKSSRRHDTKIKKNDSNLNAIPTQPTAPTSSSLQDSVGAKEMENEKASASASGVMQPQEADQAPLSMPSIPGVADISTDSPNEYDAKRAKEANVAGMKAYKDKDYGVAIMRFKEGLEANPAAHLIRFNLACTFALAGEGEKAMDILQQLKVTACEKCLHSIEKAKKDSDFDSIRNTERFKKLVE